MCLFVAQPKSEKVLEITFHTLSLTFDRGGQIFNKKLKLIWISIFQLNSMPFGPNQSHRSLIVTVSLVTFIGDSGMIKN